MLKIVFVSALLFACFGGPLPGQTAAPPAPAAELHVGGAVSTPLTLTVADLKSMSRKTLAVVNPHSQKKETYEGVLLEEIFLKARTLVSPAQVHHGSSAQKGIFIRCSQYYS